jgi:hypothetical protein
LAKVFSLHEVAQELAKATGKPVVFLGYDWNNNGDTDPTEIFKAAPIFRDNIQACGDGYGFVLCDDEPQMRKVFDSIVGDDGPTKSNSYDGAVRVYALAIDASGEMLTENT